MPYKPSQWPLLTNFSNPQRPKVLFSMHFYNEEFLLPFYIRHHSPMFDMAVLFDMRSNDSSRKILSQLAPSTLNVTYSENLIYDAEKCDDEVVKLDRMIGRFLSLLRSLLCSMNSARHWTRGIGYQVRKKLCKFHR